MYPYLPDGSSFSYFDKRAGFCKAFFLFLVFTADFLPGYVVVILPTDLHRGRARIWPLARIYVYPFDFPLPKYEAQSRIAYLTASFFGLRTIPSRPLHLWTLPDTIA